MIKALPPSIALALLTIAPLAPASTPADTYFGMAVTENSHNHRGRNLMFLDFQEQADPSVISPDVVISPRVRPGTIEIDGRAGDWDPARLTTFDALPMNNYPLSQAYDTLPGPVTVGSAFDDESIYFLVQFEDANHDASVNRNRWIFDGTGWSKMAHVPPRAGSPTAKAVNAGESVSGTESEDRVFFMFPIVDTQGAFRDGSFGCAAYCHANLVDSAAPTVAEIGTQVSRMHTSIPGDLADIWHWTSTRSAPMGTLKDAHLIYGEGSFNGRIADDGDAPEYDNDLKALKLGPSSAPAYVSRKDFEAGRYSLPGFATQLLMHDDLMPLGPDVKLAPGVSVPFSIHRPGTGSRSDVTVAANYDADTHLWTVEFRRARITGDRNDHQFTGGTAAPAPKSAPPQVGDPERGQQLFVDRACAACHGEQGEGVYENGQWVYPRNQRATGALIWKTASLHRQKRLLHLDKQGAGNATIMPFVPLTRQEAEDIAAWLQTRFTPRGR